MRRNNITAVLLLLMILFSYYLVLSNKPFIEHLRKTNSFLYALASTIIMLTFGFSIGLAWSLIINPQRDTNRQVKEGKSER